MQIKATVQVDFHLTPDGDHTLARAADAIPNCGLASGDTVLATDGDATHIAIVDSVNDGVLSLLVLWESTVPSARAV